ncbi:hypothetical protein HK102_010661, partial [Quaeritorhiza haematococci]
MYNLRLTVSKIEDCFARAGAGGGGFGPGGGGFGFGGGGSGGAPDPAQDLAYRAQTASSLYSQDLSGVVVMLTPKDFGKYASGRSANRALIERCNQSTEFHFDDIETQLKQIEADLPKAPNGEPILKEGDFFVTKHSNLPMIHLVFHLVIEDDSLNADVNGRSPLITGYRNILRTAARCDVHSLTLPLLLVPDEMVANYASSSNTTNTGSSGPPSAGFGNMVASLTSGITGGNSAAASFLSSSSSSAGITSGTPSTTNNSSITSATPTSTVNSQQQQQHGNVTTQPPPPPLEQVVYRRAELVLKHTKGLIMEHTRATKHSGDSSGVDKHSRSLVFVLP